MPSAAWITCTTSHSSPFARVDRRQDEVVLVEQRRAGEIAGGRRRIEGELAQEPAAGPRSRSPAARAGRGRRSRAAGASYRFAKSGSRNARSRSTCPAGVSIASSAHPASALRSSRTPASGRLGDLERLVEERDERRTLLVVDPAHAEPVHQAARGRRSHAVGQLQDTEPADLVVRVLEHAEQRERVLHVRGLHELQTAVLHERDVAAGEFDFEQIAVMPGAEEHRLFLQGHAFLPMRQHGAADRVTLLGLVEAGAERRHALAGSVAPQGLLVTLRAQRDHRVRGAEDRRRRTVVPFELHHGRAREPVGELQDVADGRRAEPVDRLGVVADDREVPCGALGPRPSRMSACSAFVSWYSSTSTWSNIAASGPRVASLQASAFQNSSRSS